MKYAELARLLPTELRQRMEGETVYAPWLKNGSTLESLWQDEVVLETVYNRLSAAERAVLDIIVRRIGCTPFDDARLERSAAARLSGAEIHAGCAGLRRKGLIFAFRKSWGEHVYVLPEDGLARWQRIMCPGLQPFFRERGDGEGQVEALQDGFDPVLPLFDLLVYAAKQRLKLTKSGTLTKRNLQRIAELAAWEEARLQGVVLKYAHADIYPPKVALALDALLKLNLLVRQEEELRVEPEALRRFLALPRSAQNSRLYVWWKDIAFPDTVWLQHAALLAEAWPAAVSFEAGAILELLVKSCLLDAPSEPLEFEERLRLLQEQWLEPLRCLGWLEREPADSPWSGTGDGKAGVDAGPPPRYRWRRHPHQPAEPESDGSVGGLIVQPDFDILVPPDVPLRVQWELCCLAQEPVRDVLSVCKLTKASLKFALENGRTREEVLGFLERHAAYGVPEHVRLTVEQWAKPFGLTNVVQVTLLRCADAETAAMLGRLPALAGLLREPLGDKDYVVEPGDVKALAAALEKAGYMAGMQLDQEDGGAAGYPSLEGEELAAVRLPWQEPEAMGQGLVYARHATGYFQLDPGWPESADLYPDLRDIPSSWLKDYRNYHPSTRKEMVEKAIQLRSLLQIRKNGADYRIVPRKLQETRGTWCLTGMEAGPYSADWAGGEREQRERLPEIRLLGEDWEEMKLILPGINDKY
ncbi:Helicase conserved C-terminal domain-containing protein [Paenibacillus sp. UNCCL117]|uniref:helicase-associated domain-containing protein n=1 Tax=unclassified Paenibacillus TaxID=185978 RepID=UPI00088207F1|nr:MULTISPECIES: helicase-associated domain-containing protein [unclassified Paenibacillus]SDD99035.1 Helicase conserved C-terminal domain-containing protein [Paenibacillus sp. cl123]SFW55819.1 Helicase conserved C-terminal domain-containing protein [Paenibacillus sp. UNCCL117]